MNAKILVSYQKSLILKYLIEPLRTAAPKRHFLEIENTVESR